MFKSCLPLLLSLTLSAPAFAADSAPAQSEWQRQLVYGMQPIAGHGPYRNEGLGFAVNALPGELYRGAGQDDGVLTVLGEGRFIAVTAAYDVMFLGTTDAQMDHFVKQASGDSFQIDPKTTLAGQPAESAVIQKGDVVIKGITQRRATRGDAGILYELKLVSTRAHIDADTQAFEQLAAAFEQLPLGK